MVTGAMEHPEKIRTLANPPTLSRKFAYDLHYHSHEAMRELAKARLAVIHSRIESYLAELENEQKQKKRKARDAQAQEPEPESSPDKPPLDLPPDE